MELYYVISITDRARAQDMLDVYQSAEPAIVLTMLGKGTATTEHLSMYGLENTEKAVIGAMTDATAAKALFRAAKRKLFIDIPGNGIMMSVPVKSIGGGKTLAYLTNGKTPEGDRPEMSFAHELIVVILNEGYSDMVMDAARSAGAGGGTVLHAKGTGVNRSEKFLGVSLAHEKDVVYIVAKAGEKSAIMQAISRDAGTNTKAGAICFSLPVSEVAGLRRLDD